ncbi:MAG: hypothetical protein AAFR03_15405 [Pseudomonadota bacterium]
MPNRSQQDRHAKWTPLLGTVILSFASACASSLPSSSLAPSSSPRPEPARLADTSAETMEAVKAHLSDAVGRADVRLGPEDMATSSSVSVLPPPLSSKEDRSVAVPLVFDLELQGGTCVLVNRKTGERTRMGDIDCVPA